MPTTPRVFNGYADYYDAFYQHKNYALEADFVTAIFKKYASRRINTVLDLGCGTGAYLLEFLKRGFKVTGVDASQRMLDKAKFKSKQAGYANVKFHQGFLQEKRFNTSFDALVCLFSVIDYVCDDEQLRKAFKLAYTHVKPAGVFVFDFWHAPAVSRFNPSKERSFNWQGLTILRKSVTKLNKGTNTCDVCYTCKVFSDKKLLTTIKETHRMRYFTRTEITAFLLEAGFSKVDYLPFGRLKGQVRSSTWDVMAVAQKDKE